MSGGGHGRWASTRPVAQVGHDRDAAGLVRGRDAARERRRRPDRRPLYRTSRPWKASAVIAKVHPGRSIGRPLRHPGRINERTDAYLVASYVEGPDGLDFPRPGGSGSGTDRDQSSADVRQLPDLSTACSRTPTAPGQRAHPLRTGRDRHPRHGFPLLHGIKTPGPCRSSWATSMITPLQAGAACRSCRRRRTSHRRDRPCH